MFVFGQQVIRKFTTKAKLMIFMICYNSKSHNHNIIIQIFRDYLVTSSVEKKQTVHIFECNPCRYQNLKIENVLQKEQETEPVAFVNRSRRDKFAELQNNKGLWKPL